MKVCPKCASSLPEDAEICQCGQWLQVKRELPSTSGDEPAIVEDKSWGSRLLNIWGGCCVFPVGTVLPVKGFLVSIALFAAGYLASQALLTWLNRVTGGLHPGHKPMLGIAYLVAGIVLIATIDLTVNG